MGEIMEKITLPTKTKIAAWWMVVVGLIFSMVPLWVSLWVNEQLCYLFGLFYLSGPIIGFAPCFINLIFLFLPGIFVLLRKKWAWKFAVVSLPLGGLLEITDVLWAFSEDP